MRILFISLLLAGCATGNPGRWVNSESPNADLKKDMATCEYEAKKATAGSRYAYQTMYGELIDSCLKSKGYRYERA